MMIVQPTLEDLIFRKWQNTIEAAPDYDLPIVVVQKLIADTREIAVAAGWPAVEVHDFFVTLKDMLKARTLGHPTTKNIIRLLEIETEFN